MNRLKKTRKMWLWISGIIASVIAGLIVEYTKESSFLQIVYNAACYMWEEVVNFMNINLKLWWMLILIGIVILVIYTKSNLRIFSNATKLDTQGEALESKILNYTSENYKGILWKFSWELYGKQWNLKNLTPCCPKDGTPLCYTQCPRCDSDYFGKDGLDSEKAAILIVDNARRLLQND